MIELPENPYPKDIFKMDVAEGAKIQREKLGDKLTTSVNGAFGRHVYDFCQKDMLRWFKERLNALTCISDSGDRDKAMTSLIQELKDLAELEGKK